MPTTCCKDMLVIQLDAFIHMQSHQQVNVHHLLHALLSVSCFLNDAVRLILCLSVITVGPPESHLLC